MKRYCYYINSIFSCDSVTRGCLFNGYEIRFVCSPSYICVQSAQHLVANVRSRYKFIYFSVTAVAGVEFLTSNTHARCALRRDECAHTHTHNFMGERDFAVTGSFVNDRRAVLQRQINTRLSDNVNSYVKVISLASFDYQFYVCPLEFERVAQQAAPFDMYLVHARLVVSRREARCPPADGFSQFECPCSLRAAQPLHKSICADI